ncbi:lysozyme [Apilactobacillus timberlakei]|uniref:lysozyme n=1 Tax=Apilactobacillus timberlakei TaxID=2008380 RepID=UPI00112917D2|nr:lysozyme [Apilactobacillus timberlakei]TPR16278.1 lysozyme [Apilactobacillus timberlakei]TPR21551.1 lysozyme [Apilactobacillus timberlakei]
MKISKRGINLIKSFESYRYHAYIPVGGDVWTVGYGHTKGVHKYTKASKAKAEELLIDDLQGFESAVRRRVHVKINQNQFDALTSFLYNLGEYAAPDVFAAINERHFKTAAKYMKEYDKGPGYTVLAGLVNRRKKEVALFLRK